MTLINKILTMLPKQQFSTSVPLGQIHKMFSTTKLHKISIYAFFYAIYCFWSYI